LKNVASDGRVKSKKTNPSHNAWRVPEQVAARCLPLK
jgi:hypothetical protein